jgi:hypothetical protein
MGSKLRAARFTVVVADWLLDDILARYPGLRPSQVVLGHMGVDTRKWVPEEGPSDDPPFRLATVARLHHAKGYNVLPRPVVVMEALALGLPVVGTDAGGIPEIITTERDGLVVPAEDDERLAEAIARLMDDPELRRRLGTNARQTAIERFDSRIGAASLYEHLFGASPPATSAPAS